MTKEQIESVLNRVHSWPKSRQEDAALLLLAMEAQETGTYRLSPDERADLESALQELAGGDLASSKEVAETFARYRK